VNNQKWHGRDVGAYLLDVLVNEQASVGPFSDDPDTREDAGLERARRRVERQLNRKLAFAMGAKKKRILSPEEREISHRMDADVDAWLVGFDARSAAIKHSYYEHSERSEAKAEAAEMYFIGELRRWSRTFAATRFGILGALQPVGVS
jgi:hypothetical protein